MSVLLVTYDLNTPGQNYSKVLDYIKSFAAWARVSKSAYAIKTDLDPASVRDAVLALADKNDHVYVLALAGNWAGQGPPEVNSWLSSELTPLMIQEALEKALKGYMGKAA